MVRGVPHDGGGLPGGRSPLPFGFLDLTESLSILVGSSTPFSADKFR